VQTLSSKLSAQAAQHSLRYKNNLPQIN